MMETVQRISTGGMDALSGLFSQIAPPAEAAPVASLPQMLERPGREARQPGGFSIGDIHIHAAAGMDPRAIAEQVRRVIRDEARGGIRAA